MKRSHWKNQYVVNESASKFHNRVRDIFSSDPFFSSLGCYQEVAVSDLVADYEYTNHHFDWYIEELQTIVELHGSQHYKMANYGNISYDAAMKQFWMIQERDSLKMSAVVEAGYTYRTVSYKNANKLTAKLLKEIILTEG